MVLEDLTSFMVPASCTREHQCNPHLRDIEITHEDAEGLSCGEQRGRETQVLRTPVDPEKRGCFLPLETTATTARPLVHRQYSSFIPLLSPVPALG